MNEELDKYTLPSAAIPYVLYQRTQYKLNHPLYVFLTAVGYVPQLYKWSIEQKSKRFAKEIEQQYWTDMQQEYQTFRSVLPKNAAKILDIGSGLAAVDVFLSAHYNSNVEIHLLDKTSIDQSIHYHLKDSGSYYNSLHLARQLLVDNGVPEKHIYLHEANDQYSVDIESPVDLVISLISWGFHYPVQTYIKQIARLISAEGSLIIDVRSDSRGREELQKYFYTCTAIVQTKKFERLLCQQIKAYS